MAWSDFGMMDAMRLDATARERLGTRLAAVFGAFAVLLAGLGLAGVMAFIVGQREAEIGVRLALGADESMIAHLLAGQGVRLALLGAAIGLVTFFVAWPVTTHFVAGLHFPDVITFVIAVGLILLVGVSAAYLPARRAARLDPLAVLRGG
jgi:putative ABC transport system permease protein